MGMNMTKLNMNMNMNMNTDNEQEYGNNNDDWETMSFHFDSDDEEDVREYVNEIKTVPKPTAITSGKKTCNSSRDENNTQEEINTVKTRLTWCKPKPREIESDSDDEEIISKSQVVKLDPDYPTIAQAFILKVQKCNIVDVSGGWKTVISTKTEKPAITQILSNPLLIGKLLQKTRLCHSVKSNIKCPHGNFCRFAHTKEELTIGDCFYGESCMFVNKQDSVYSNSRDNLCNRLHPNEKREDYCIRTGLTKRAAPTEAEMVETFAELLDPAVAKKFSSCRVFGNVQHKPKKPDIIDSRKLVSESLDSQKIKERNTISTRIRGAKISMERKRETIDRFKQMNYITEFYKKQIVKLETELTVYSAELVALDAKLKAVEYMKKIEVVQPKIEGAIVSEKIKYNIKRDVLAFTKSVFGNYISANSVFSKPFESSLVAKTFVDKPFIRKPVEVKPFVRHSFKPIEDKFDTIQPLKIVEVIPVDEPEWIEVNKKRTNAFNILEDKSKINKKMSKTKMCDSVKKNTQCRHYGKECRFAHSKVELVVSTCIFGSACKFVTCTQNGFVNVDKTKPCEHKHPEEHINNYYYRIGIDKIPVRSKPLTIIIKKTDLNMNAKSWVNITKN